MSTQNPRWQNAERGKVSQLVFERVSSLELEQADMYDRFVKLEALYDPNGQAAALTDTKADMMGVCENGIASNVDTVTAVVATTDVRSRFMTDDASWSEQRRARLLELYIEGVAKLYERPAKCRLSFKGAAKKGTGLVKVYEDGFEQLRVEHVIVDDIVIDLRHRSRPREMHQRQFLDRDELIAEFPKYERQISDAHGGSSGGLWAGYRPFGESEVVMLESWYLPFGTEGHRNYRPGRHTKTIENCDLLDEKWDKPRFPFAKNPWTERDDAWHGIGGVERIAGTQRALNRRNLQIERGNDQGAFPTTYVRQADAGLMIKATNRIGNIVPYKSDPPVTVIAPAVSGETYKSREDLRESMNNEFGHSSMATHGMTPAGLETGAAVREWRDVTTQRFATQEKYFEESNLDVDWLILDVCKSLGARGKAPEIARTTRWGTNRITWSKVDMGELRVQIAAASTLPRTPAGRRQLALEWAQAGIISQDVAKRLIGHHDVEKEWSLFSAAIEAIEEQLEAIADGEVVMPEPYDNLKLAAFRGHETYLTWRSAGAPEDVLEAIRQFIVQAIYMDSGGVAANQDAAPAMPGDASAGAMPPDTTSLTPQLQGGMPAESAPMAAFSPQAMQLRAG